MANEISGVWSPEKFSEKAWQLNNRYRNHVSEVQQELANRLMVESDRIRDLTTETVKANKKETDYRLEEKIKDIEYRKGELQSVRKEVQLETETLLMYKERLHNGICSIKKNALSICEKCISAREHRVGIDLVHDEVERQLKQELDTIKSVESLFIRLLEQNQEQIRRLKSTTYYLDRDLQGKESNLKIDQQNLTLKETSHDLDSFKKHTCDISGMTLRQWEKQTDDNIISAMKEINSSKRMHCHIDNIIKQVVDDLNNQKNATDVAFSASINKTRREKMKFEFQHSDIARQINEMKCNISQFQKALAEKDKYMALAQARFNNRCQRPKTELTSDLVEKQLAKEIVDIKDIINQLKKSLSEAEVSLCKLQKTEIQLEEEINIKMNTLKIDEVECITYRQSMNYHLY